MDTLYLKNEKAINEIKYFVMLIAIKRLLEQKKITPENFRLVNIALTEKYGVLPLYI